LCYAKPTRIATFNKQNRIATRKWSNGISPTTTFCQKEKEKKSEIIKCCWEEEVVRDSPTMGHR